MKFSIIIPSYNQSEYIERTLKNVAALKSAAAENGYIIEVLLFDSCSDEPTQQIIKKFNSIFDHLDISKDKGQYDAINKGMLKATGDYWTWLNTDDYIDIPGFLKVADLITKNKIIDYIYGCIDVIDENDKLIRVGIAKDLSLQHLLNRDAGIYQPGSFFKKSVTDKIGFLHNYNACFDYEYIIRLLKAKANFYRCNFVVAKFRYYNTSKSGSIVPVFIKDQLHISKKYGRKTFSPLTLLLNLRLIKHFLFPRK